MGRLAHLAPQVGNLSPRAIQLVIQAEGSQGGIQVADNQLEKTTLQGSLVDSLVESQHEQA